MAHSYTPGLKVAKKTMIKKSRILPLKGNVLKKVGDIISRDDVVARTELPGGVRTLNIVNRLGILPDDIKSYMNKQEGEPFARGEVIAESRPIIKWFKTKVAAPMDGKIESISAITGQVLLREPPVPVEVHGYVNGKVIEVVPNEGIIVETVATFIQGIFGIGGETWGKLVFAVDSADEILTNEKIKDEYKDCIIVGGSFTNYETIQKAIQAGVKGIIVGGIQDGDLKKILGYDLGVAITGSENIGLTVLLTEGFGQISIAKRTFNTLKEREGEMTSISGATQIRAGVIRPEIIIPYNNASQSDVIEDINKIKPIEEGSHIRVIRPPHFGKIGIVHSLPHELRQIESETKARILEVKFPDGKIEVVPRANIEMIES